MFSRIVVPLDGSELAERALRPARALARCSEAELRLVRVADSEKLFLPAGPGMGVLYPDPALAQAKQEAARYLTALRGLYAATDLALRVEVRTGDVAGTIVDVARQARAELILMSSHGYSGVKRWLLGSVAERVLNAAPCPVWVVRTPAPPQRVLITLDGSSLAEEVLRPAIGVARCFGAAVTLLRVVPEIAVRDVEALEDYERGLGHRLIDETHEEAAAYLTLVAQRYGYADLQIETAVRSGPAAEAILAYADGHAVDLAAMTTHGRTGLRRWRYGSVTHKVLSELPISMLVARPWGGDLN